VKLLFKAHRVIPQRALSWRTAAALLLATVCLAANPAMGQALRWAIQGDPLTMDPHSQNEGLNNAINGQVYERLTRYDQQLNLVPSLATGWQQTGPLRWRFKLRPDVKFHDGAPLTADDVVFSVQRAQSPVSTFSVYANALGKPVAIDPLTVEFRLSKINPIFLQHVDSIAIMSRAWAQQHRVTQPLDLWRCRAGSAPAV
jgi:peptide/nickel transport system substrate-binding protein